ncbi:hypothetical protein C0993_005957 [Termitomyces sp. T159_Od127]|nr:hypothetical protein C0993_005957 [Termitomyces sp. T159_Od127]
MDSSGVITTTHTSNNGIDLSVMDYHPWPTCLTVAVAKLLDDAHIANTMWGDLLYWWCGNPHVPQICGFIVPSDQLETAVSVVEKAGLPSCNCESNFHFADWNKPIWLPKHFRVPQPYNMFMTLFLCPSDRLLDLVPLDSSHPNPAGLQYDKYALPLYDHYLPTIPLVPGAEVPADYYAIKVLTPTSLIEVLLLLAAFSSLFDGVGRHFTDLLARFAFASIDKPYVLQSPALQQVWDSYYVRMERFPAHEVKKKMLWDNVRVEWMTKLSLK